MRDVWCPGEFEMLRKVILFALFGTILAACAPDSRDIACAAQAQGNMRWGYYPGYGCGPVPKAQTTFP